MKMLYKRTAVILAIALCTVFANAAQIYFQFTDGAAWWGNDGAKFGAIFRAGMSEQDYFLSVLDGLLEDKTVKEPKQIKDRIEQITRQHNEAAGKPYPIEMSTGISEFLCGTDIDIHEIIERADEKLYKEKAEKKAKNGSYR